MNTVPVYDKAVQDTDYLELVMAYRAAAKQALSRVFTELRNDPTEKQRVGDVIKGGLEVTQDYLKRVDATNMDTALLAIETLTCVVLDMMASHAKSMGEGYKDHRAFATAYTTTLSELVMHGVLRSLEDANKGTIN